MKVESSLVSGHDHATVTLIKEENVTSSLETPAPVPCQSLPLTRVTATLTSHPAVSFFLPLSLL